MQKWCPSVFSRVHDLFSEEKDVDPASATSAAPLATRMRPRSLEEFVGQEHILAPGKLLRRAIEADRLPSVIFSGPPGTGKTTLAHVIAEMTHSKFIRLSGVESNVTEMRRAIAAATNRLRTSGQKTILFIDEIHHFNKAQQDILLPDVESGNLRLIGATTYNPFFYVNSPLVSRSQVFQLEPLSVEQLEELIDRALADKERGLGNYTVKIDNEARRHLAKLSDGDARKCLNALEIGVLTTPPDPRGAIHFTLAVAEESIQQKAIVYDRAGDAIGSQKCCTPVKTFALSRGASSSLRVKTSAWPIRKRYHSLSPRSKRSNSSACLKRAFPSPTPRPTCAARKRVAMPTTRSTPPPTRSRWNEQNGSPKN